MILLRRKPVRLTVQDLMRLEPDEPREISSLQHNVRQLRGQAAELRRQNAELGGQNAELSGQNAELSGQNAELGGQLDAAHTDLGQRIGEIADLKQKLRTADEDLALHRAWLGEIQGSVSWRVTAPARAARQHLKRLRT